MNKIIIDDEIDNEIELEEINEAGFTKSDYLDPDDFYNNPDGLLKIDMI